MAIRLPFYLLTPPLLRRHGEVLQHQVPGLGSVSGRRCTGGHGPGAQDARRRAGRHCRHPAGARVHSGRPQQRQSPHCTGVHTELAPELTQRRSSHSAGAHTAPELTQHQSSHGARAAHSTRVHTEMAPAHACRTLLCFFFFIKNLSGCSDHTR